MTVFVDLTSGGPASLQSQITIGGVVTLFLDKQLQLLAYYFSTVLSGQTTASELLGVQPGDSGRGKVVTRM